MKRHIAVLIAVALIGVGGTSLYSQGSMEPEPMGMEMEMKMEAESPHMPFTTIEDAQALAANGPTVLFFYATWCPSCRTALAEINERPADLEAVSLVIVDYDTENDLKKRYSVTYQHTFVQIDTDGAMVTAWNGGGVDDILGNIVK